MFVALLLDYGAVNSKTNLFRGTPLDRAVGRGELEIARLLLDRGADVMVYDRYAGMTIAEPVGSSLEPEETPQRPMTSESLIRRAVRLGQKTLIQILQTRQATATDSEIPSNRLDTAVLMGQTEVVQLLLAGGDDVFLEYAAQQSTLDLAIYFGNEVIVGLLLDQGEIITSLDRLNTGLHHAIHCGQDGITKMLLHRGAQIETKDEFDDTPLHRAVKGNSPSIVNLLLDMGAGIEGKDGSGKSPLYRAQRLNHTSIVEILHDRGAVAVPKFVRV